MFNIILLLSMGPLAQARGTCSYPANTGHSPSAVLMLAHRLRRWPDIETALGECPVFAGRIPRSCE